MTAWTRAYEMEIIAYLRLQSGHVMGAQTKGERKKADLRIDPLRSVVGRLSSVC